MCVVRLLRMGTHCDPTSISLIINVVEHLFFNLLTIQFPLMEKHFHVLSLFFYWLFFFLWSSSNIPDTSPLSLIDIASKYLIPVCGSSFYFSWLSLQVVKSVSLFFYNYFSLYHVEEILLYLYRYSSTLFPKGVAFHI